ncbi:MAG: N-acetyltransferase [Hyphomicrobiaceae bacterium]
MNVDVQIRACHGADLNALEGLYPAAFPDEDLLPLLRALFDEKDEVASFVAISDGALVGHCAVTRCRLEECGQMVGLLGPVAVAPAFQRQGIGTAIIEEALDHMKISGAMQVHVLGDPAYYGRFGFAPDRNVKAPYALPPEWRDGWQSIRLQGEGRTLKGTLIVPRPWRERRLWAP